MSLWVYYWMESCKHQYSQQVSEAKGSSAIIGGFFLCREVSQQEIPPAVNKLYPKKRKLEEIVHKLPRNQERMRGGESQGQRSGASRKGRGAMGLAGWLAGGSRVTPPPPGQHSFGWLFGNGHKNEIYWL